MKASALRPGPAGTLITPIQVSAGGPSSDQLDAAIVAGDAAVAIYHQQVNVGEIPADRSGRVPPCRGPASERMTLSCKMICLAIAIWPTR